MIRDIENGYPRIMDTGNFFILVC